jgi:hypothetical protein
VYVGVLHTRARTRARSVSGMSDRHLRTRSSTRTHALTPACTHTAPISDLHPRRSLSVVGYVDASADAIVQTRISCMSLGTCVCACRGDYLCPRPCACRCACACVQQCVFACVRLRAHARGAVRARLRVFVHTCSVSACACVRAFPSDCTFARVCSERVFAYRTRVRAPALCSHSRGAAATCGINSSARATLCGRACVVAFDATGRARARWPQVSPSPIVPSKRNGLSEKGSRPWSTPPAPSTSSAATATPTTSSSRTCGRAPTEVRVRTRSRGGGWVLGAYSTVVKECLRYLVCTRKVLDGY